MTDVEAALTRVQSQLGPADYDLFRRLVNTLAAVTSILNSQRAMIARLRRLFGLPTPPRKPSPPELRKPSVGVAADSESTGLSVSTQDQFRRVANMERARLEARMQHGEHERRARCQGAPHSREHPAMIGHVHQHRSCGFGPQLAQSSVERCTCDASQTYS
jgi:hypothetical protein